jgi:hypothetical protein
MKREFEKYLRVHYTRQNVFSELDFVNEDQIFGKHPEGDSWFYDSIETKVPSINYPNIATPINIDDAIKTLQDFKESGCTHVEIEHDSDHYGYTFLGLEMREATKEEIAEHTKQQEDVDEAAKAAKIAMLEAELNELKSNQSK